MEHKIKILDKFHTQIQKGEKTFEIRKNDRNYKKGDTIHFIVIKDGNYYEGNELEITDVFQEKGFGLQEGYCILSFKLK